MFRHDVLFKATDHTPLLHIIDIRVKDVRCFLLMLLLLLVKFFFLVFSFVSVPFFIQIIMDINFAIDYDVHLYKHEPVESYSFCLRALHYQTMFYSN